MSGFEQWLSVELDALNVRCNTLNMRLNQCLLDAERWAKAFDVAVELRERIEDKLTEKIEELTKDNSDLQKMLGDAIAAERALEDELEARKADVTHLPEVPL